MSPCMEFLIILVFFKKCLHSACGVPQALIHVYRKCLFLNKSNNVMFLANTSSLAQIITRASSDGLQGPFKNQKRISGAFSNCGKS